LCRWRVTASDPKDSWKVTQREKGAVVLENPTPPAPKEARRVCPFAAHTPTPSPSATQAGEELHVEKRTNSSFNEEPVDDSSESTNEGRGPTPPSTAEAKSIPASRDITISSCKMKEIFPYHVVVDRDFGILQVGKDLPSLLNVMESDIVGVSFKKIVRIVKPVHGVWNWQALRKLEDQTFFMTPMDHVYEAIKLKGNMVRISTDPFQVMFVLSPDAKNVTELRQMNLTMSDLPLHSFQRDAVFLGEHIASEVKSAHKLDKLSKKLEHEKNLSNSLLYSLLPKHVADELRAGNTVEPEFHENVTVFFSDIVGFTTICDGIHSWEVIDLLNRLYCVMDYLCGKFGLYKIDTIGDAFICCSGLPEENENHADNVANFAVAVRHCVTQVVSPIDGEPIVMRMGIHTGQCMSGVVGMTTPRYCVFSDTMNTASRHESTCEPGRIQCSSITFGQLAHFSRHETPQFNFTPRGLIDMKGKGKMFTYWIEGGTSDNQLTNRKALDELYVEVEEMLSTKTFVNKKYFDRWARSRNSFSTTTTDCTFDDDPELAAMLAAELAQMEGDLDDFD
jgi:class 3 adenylate cyclase